ncbi:hypothetical protein ACG0Z4_21905 [Enterocloster aldenensis]|uniref:hypothetical protein n=1 Tax=Enterocloster aldenensis TaxID=358742 RepID=UPI0040267531
MNNSEYWALYRAAFKFTELTDEEITSIHDLYQKEGHNKIYQQLKKKKIIPAAASLFVRLNIDRDYWEPISDSYRKRNNVVVKCLDDVYKALVDAGATRIGVVENFGALLHSESDLAMFGSGDVDNYADLAEKELIYNVFNKLGYEITECRAGNILISSGFRNCPELPEGFYFGINWDVTTRINLPCLTSKKQFVDWSMSTYYKKTKIRIPPAEALMYICLMHIAVHGFCKSPDIRLYYDIANVAKKELDWMKIKEWAIRDENQLRIAVASTLANRLLDVSIPNDILLLGDSRRRKRLLKQVSDSENNSLKDFPNRLTSLGIDVCSCDRGIVEGFKYVFFPQNDWLERKYGSIAIGSIKHIIDLV